MPVTLIIRELKGEPFGDRRTMTETSRQVDKPAITAPLFILSKAIQVRTPHPFPRCMASASQTLDPSELKAHLGLLRVFHDFKRQAEGGTESELNAQTSNPEERWKSFVKTSVWKCVGSQPTPPGVLTFRCGRFHEWVSNLGTNNNSTIEEVKRPSLDACLVWHAYMLNPRYMSIGLRPVWEPEADADPSCYAEDSKQVEVLKPLKAMSSCLLDLFVRGLLKGEVFPQESTTALPSDWVEGGGHPFSLDLVTAVRISPLTTRCLD